jgi:7-carboxy-7-deazaguanine synthase
MINELISKIPEKDSPIGAVRRIDRGDLPVMESFYTIQGEGFHSGAAAYFIRLGGCDVGCHWCDVKESWDADIHPKISIENIVNEASKYEGRLAVITGGEPLMHNLNELTNTLQTAGFQTNIESSGVCESITGEWDWICFSPKKFKTPNPSIYEKADELKVIIYNNSDFDFANEHSKHVKSDCKLYLQPEWSRQLEMTPKIIEFIKANPKWKISLQTHKFMDIP